MKPLSSTWAFSCLALLIISCLFPAREATAQEPVPELFSGERRVFVANGYSTTRNWPTVLQRKVDRYFDNQKVIEVINAYKSGHPISKWIDVTTGEPLGPWTKELLPALQSDLSVPTVLLAQQSLQWVFSDNRTVGIVDENDTARIEQGADAIQLYAEQALTDGAEVVLMAMHIYRDEFEPVIGNERYALAEALTRGIDNFFEGPDVWTPMKEYFPLAYAKDFVHPNPIGDEIMAHYWFARLLEFDGKNVPEWSRQEMEAAILEGGGDIGENSPPVADLQASPLSGPAPLTVTFDGSGSTDIDGVIVAHDWIFPDGSNDATEIVKHAFKTAGEHLIKLKVTDDFGDSDNAEITITVTAAEAIYYGDTTGDGTISAFDAAAILMHTAGITPLTGDAALSADVSGNGNISALDASYILQFSVGLIDCFPVEAGCPVK